MIELGLLLFGLGVGFYLGWKYDDKIVAYFRHAKASLKLKLAKWLK